MIDYPGVELIEILLVEDSPADVRLTEGGAERGALITRLNVVSEGVEAMSYLRREGKYAEAVRPDSTTAGPQPAQERRQGSAEGDKDRQLKIIPVVVYDPSRAEEDVVRSYDLHANCYITKPIDLNQFSRVVKTIQEFWLTIEAAAAHRGFCIWRRIE